MTMERLDIHSCEDQFQVALHRVRYDFALQYLRPDDTMLEVGTGLGAFTEEVCSLCAGYTGVEFDEASCRVARERTGANVIQGDARHLVFSEDQFSYIVCLEVLEHLGDWKAGIREIHRCVQPQGRIVISVPWRKYGGKSSINEYHLYEPGEQELVSLFKELFRKVDVFYLYFPETPLMKFARKLHLRRLLRLHQLYANLVNGVPAATACLRINAAAKGMRLGLLLVAGGKK